MVAPELGFRFAGFRDALAAAFGFSPGFPDGCGRDESDVEGAASFGAGRLRSPRVCPVR